MKIFILLLLIGTSNLVYSQNFEKFSLIIGYGNSTSELVAGYSDVTTDNYDDEYEHDLPPFTPPSGSILTAFRIIREYEEAPDELIFTDIDFKAEPENDIDTLYYEIDILGVRDEGIEFNMYVPRTNLSEKITEIRLTDDVSDGNLIDTNLLDGNLYQFDNRFLDDFTVRVIIDKNRTNISEKAESNNVKFFNNMIHLNGTYADKLKIYNLSGALQLDIPIYGDNVSLQELKTGIYFAYIFDSNLVISMIKIVKL